jgi:hypothetical protein
VGFFVRKDLILLTSIMLLATLAPPRKILVPMTPEHWKILITSSTEVQSGYIIIYDYEPERDGLRDWMMERLGTTTPTAPGSNRAPIGIHCISQRDGEEKCSGSMGVGVTAVWLPSDSTW